MSGRSYGHRNLTELKSNAKLRAILLIRTRAARCISYQQWQSKVMHIVKKIIQYLQKVSSNSINNHYSHLSRKKCESCHWPLVFGVRLNWAFFLKKVRYFM